MPQPTPHSAFSRECAWDENRQHAFSFNSRRQNDNNERIALPSIRQAIPEINNTRIPSSAAASPVGGFGAGALTPPSYIHSPNQNKRRRLSIGDDREERSSHIPRMYPSPQREYHGSRGMSPAPTSRSAATDSWASPPRRSPYASSHPSLPSMRDTMPPVEPSDSRPTLPRLPTMNFDRAYSAMPRIRDRSADEDYLDNFRHMVHPDAAAAGHGHYRSGSSYYSSHHHPSRIQSLSLSSVQSFDRTPFSSSQGSYHVTYQDYMRNEMAAAMGMGENKQRKRRGNLPKETTDKLRAWFISHLHHPYPTEDEKQELMRQTGLQMNQISNWFINARRRQLPTLLNNARAESDAMSSGRRSDLKRDSPPMSDGEGSVYDDDLEALRRRHAVSMSRGSV
ncbi:homeobox KN domain-containing protein [Podospora fimiseda]|uniref:Homeobox KN domain-containing protein n=1 Tax=Podospora fimiseda TaxID=252190 RepID=A0AAN7BXP6_9PEZI|nr:homeobox KN domain-containing protein [Podospora fimiseda]